MRKMTITEAKQLERCIRQAYNCAATMRQRLADTMREGDGHYTDEFYDVSSLESVMESLVERFSHIFAKSAASPSRGAPLWEGDI